MRQDKAISAMTLATLMHDCSLESAFRSKSLDVIDGFGEPVHGVRYWDRDILMQDARFRLIKLHGSLDWYRFRTMGKGWESERVGIPVSGSPIGTVDPDGNRQDAPEERPLFLVGTFNKILSYSSGIYSDLQCAFRSSLHRSSRLVVCGYSFGDKGINSQILEWIYGALDRRIVVIHPKPEELSTGARGAIAGKWHDLRSEHRLAEIPLPMEKTTWDLLRAHVVGNG